MSPVPAPTTVDPMREGLIQELRAIRRGHGPYAVRLAHRPWLIDSLGHGMLERAVEELEQLRSRYGGNPEEPIGAFFWLADQGLDNPSISLEKRQDQYRDTFACDPRTALRRSDTGIEALAAIARDQTEEARPVGMFWFFQGTTATAVIDFWLGLESYREPVITVNGDVIEHDFVVHRDPQDRWGDRYRSRLILDELPLSLDHEAYEAALTVRAAWQMPIWPVWQITAWIADPRFAVRLQVFRDRAAEASLIIRPDRARVNQLTESVHTT